MQAKLLWTSCVKQDLTPQTRKQSDTPHQSVRGIEDVDDKVASLFPSIISRV